jgi:hypothetical protein
MTTIVETVQIETVDTLKDATRDAQTAVETAKKSIRTIASKPTKKK